MIFSWKTVTYNFLDLILLLDFTLNQTMTRIKTKTTTPVFFSIPCLMADF